MDSSASIKYLNSSLPVHAISFLDKQLDQEINLSIISKIELLSWTPPVAKDLLIVQKFTKEAIVFPIDESICDLAVAIRKLTKVKLPDILIAATAILNDFTLIADNDKDFSKIQAINVGLKYLNPFLITSNTIL